MEIIKQSVKIRLALLLLVLLGTFFLTGCHYQLGYGGIAQKYQTISIPYIQGDKDGNLTSAIIRRMSTSGALRYVPCGGEIILNGKLVDLTDENIGFRYDKKKDGELKKSIIPVETRLTATVEIHIIESATGRVIVGPVRISASVEFDHDDYSSRHAINIFSLGQLGDIDAAHEAAIHPLNRQLAEKIVDYLINSW